jgi:phosphinothricin acetyltransferase
MSNEVLSVPAGPVIRVADLLAEHAAQVLEIYQLGIDEGQATFEIAAPAWEKFDAAKLPVWRDVVLIERRSRVVS